MSIIDIEKTTDLTNFDEPEDMICHLYYEYGKAITHCGIPVKKDCHAMYHWQRKDISTTITTRINFCSQCGAPVCPKCKELSGL